MKTVNAATVLIAALGTCASHAQTPPAVLYACVGSSGLPQLVTAGTACKKNETLVSWNVAGPPGPRGPSNAYVANSAAAAASPLSTDPSHPSRLLTLALPAGNYVVNGIAGLYASVDFGTLVPFANVGCVLAGSGGAISATFRTTVGGKPQSHASVPLAAAIALPSADAVSLDCVAESTNGVTVWSQPSTLTGIQVDALANQ